MKEKIKTENVLCLPFKIRQLATFKVKVTPVKVLCLPFKIRQLAT